MANGWTSSLAKVTHGILWMLLTTFLFVSSNAAAKYLAHTYSSPQVTWGRFVFQALLLIPFLPRLHRLVVTRHLGLHLLRSVFIVGSGILFFVALQLLPLADASAILFTAPLMITALSVPLLGETVGLRRWLAVVAGFAGALIIIRPGVTVLQPAVTVPLAAAIVFAMVQISTRMISRHDGTLTNFVLSTLISALYISAIVPFYWTTPDAVAWVWMAAMGLIGGLGQFTLIKAFEAAPAAVLAPYNYTGLIWAALLGFAMFGDLPDLWTVVGAAIITASGLYVFRRAPRPSVPP